MNPRAPGRSRRALAALLTTAAVAATLVAFAPSAAALLASTGYHPLTDQVRVLDTRTGTGGIRNPIPAGQTVSMTIPQQLGIPASQVSAVVMNVTVVNPPTAGYVSIFPTGSGTPAVSSVNFNAGENTPNLVNVQLRADGSVSALNGAAGAVDLLFDVVGWYGTASAPANGSEYVSITPVRAKDSRTDPFYASLGGLAPGGTYTLRTTDAAVYETYVMNVTITAPQGSGFVTIGPGDTPAPTAANPPTTSNLNVYPGRDVANSVVVRRGTDTDQTIRIYNGTSGYLHFIMDIVGAFYIGPSDANGLFTPVTPYRTYDTRQPTTSGIIAAGPAGTRRLNMNSLPPEATAVVVNVTVADSTNDGWVSVYPGDVFPGTSTVNFQAHRAKANLALVKITTDGSGNRIMSIRVGESGFAHVIIDIFGYYS